MKTAKESAACQTANSTCTTVQSRGDKLAQREDGGKLWLTRSTVQAVVGKCHCRIKFCNCLYQPCSRNWNLSSISGKCSQPVTQGYPKMRKWIQCDYCPLCITVFVLEQHTKCQRQDVQVYFLHQGLTTSSQSSEAGHTWHSLALLPFYPANFWWPYTSCSSQSVVEITVGHWSISERFS